MALSVFVLKTSETEDIVTYEYESGPDSLIGQVTIQKAANAPVGEDSLSGSDRTALKAIFKAKARAEGWPHHYMYAA